MLTPHAPAAFLTLPLRPTVIILPRLPPNPHPSGGRLSQAPLGAGEDEEQQVEELCFSHLSSPGKALPLGWLLPFCRGSAPSCLVLLLPCSERWSKDLLISTPSRTSLPPLLTAGHFGRAEREQFAQTPSEGREERTWESQRGHNGLIRQAVTFSQERKQNAAETKVSSRRGAYSDPHLLLAT